MSAGGQVPVHRPVRARLLVQGRQVTLLLPPHRVPLHQCIVTRDTCIVTPHLVQHVPARGGDEARRVQQPALVVGAHADHVDRARAVELRPLVLRRHVARG